MNFWRLPEFELMSLNADRVGPGSVKDQPPTEIQVWRPLLVSFSAVNRLYSFPLLPSIGAIWKVVGSKKANAKLT
jgi:hypothetical protein